ncbi:MAG: type 1 glutamine amidotransferase [Pseudomonadota bacterium]|nr:type 1 glutamine amidotransferase [Pseudomonadota bacterium]
MRIRCLQHVPFENAGAIADWARAEGHDWATVPVWEAALPTPDRFDWLIVMGGPMSVHDVARYPWLEAEQALLREALDRGRRVLGICLGAQLLATALGGVVSAARTPEIGWWPIAVTVAGADCPVTGWPPELTVFHWHGEQFDLPPGATSLARSEACPHQGFHLGPRVVGLQFHLEMLPQGIERLATACSDDLVPGPFVQQRERLAGTPAQRRQALAALHRLLGAMAT